MRSRAASAFYFLFLGKLLERGGAADADAVIGAEEELHEEEGGILFREEFS